MITVAIDEMVAARGLLLHPFYQTWTRGELSLETLRDYARQYFQHVAAFPTYISALHARTEDLETRRQLLANLIDEEAGDPNHPELWLQFAGSLGLSREDVLQTAPWPETAALVDTFRSICGQRSTAEGLVALYAYESQVPAVSESKIAGLREFYGIKDARGLGYFQVHIEADREHSSVERRLLERYLNGESARAALEAARETLDALWEMLSGVCRRHAIAC